MAPHLPSLLPHLISCLNEAHPLVKSISCWTLSRYAKWASDPPRDVVKNDEEMKRHMSTYFAPLLEGVNFYLFLMKSS